MNFKKLIPCLVLLDIAFMVVCYWGGFYCFCTGSYQYCQTFLYPLFPNFLIVGVLSWVIYKIRDVPFFRRTFVPAFIPRATLLDAYFSDIYFHAKNENVFGHKVELYIEHIIFLFLAILWLGAVCIKNVKSGVLPNSDNFSAANMLFGDLIIIQLTLIFLGVIWRNARTSGPEEHSDKDETDKSETEDPTAAKSVTIDLSDIQYYINSKVLLSAVLLTLFSCCFCISNVYFAVTAFILIALTALAWTIIRIYKRDWSISVSMMFIDVIFQWILIFCIILLSIKFSKPYSSRIIEYVTLFSDAFLTLLTWFCAFMLFKPAPSPLPPTHGIKKHKPKKQKQKRQRIYAKHHVLDRLYEAVRMFDAFFDRLGISEERREEMIDQLNQSKHPHFTEVWGHFSPEEYLKSYTWIKGCIQEFEQEDSPKGIHYYNCETIGYWHRDHGVARGYCNDEMECKLSDAVDEACDFYMQYFNGRNIVPERESQSNSKRGCCGLFFIMLILTIIAAIISILFLNFIEYIQTLD